MFTSTSLTTLHCYCFSTTSSGVPSSSPCLLCYLSRTVPGTVSSDVFKTFPTFASSSLHHQKPQTSVCQTSPGPRCTSSIVTRRASCCRPSSESYSPTYSWTSGSLSSNYSLTFWNFVKLLPLLLLKRLNTWICYFNWTAYRGCPEVLTGI